MTFGRVRRTASAAGTALAFATLCTAGAATAQWLDAGASQRLSEAIERLEAVAASGGWPRLPDGPVLKPGDRNPQIATLRRRLKATGDLSPAAGSGDLLDDVLTAAVRQFQRRHGLAVDGIVGPETRAALRVTADERIATLGHNRERARNARPGPPDTTRIEINIPAYEFVALHEGDVVLRSRFTSSIGPPGWIGRDGSIFAGTSTAATVRPRLDPRGKSHRPRQRTSAARWMLPERWLRAPPDLHQCEAGGPARESSTSAIRYGKDWADG